MDADTDQVITADMLVENVDFRLDWATARQIGHKSLAVSLSDVAAMGAAPKWAMLSIAVPERLWNTGFLDDLYVGWHALADKFGVELVGGDISRSPDLLVIDSIVGGDAAFGPENVITAVAHGHQAAISIDLFCKGEDLHKRPDPFVNLVSQKMGIHEWAYDSEVANDPRYVVPQAPKELTLKDRKREVELGFDALAGYKEAERCLNCDVQTVFNAPKCIECDACVDICPTSCITFTANAPEEELRKMTKVPALNLKQDLYVSEPVPQTGRIMAKDEDVCLHCGLCAERCPTAAWDMQKFWYNVTKAGEVKYGNFVQIERNVTV